MEKKFIICVDDEKIILNSLKTQLKNEYGNQFIYETAENAKEAEELIEELNLDGNSILIIVSDWLMPGMKGDEFLIRIHAKHPEIKKILLTGQATDEGIMRAITEADLLKCLNKPWSEAELIDTINMALNTKQDK